MNVILAGMPGSGKTTVAEVFKSRGKTVIDTDEEIVKKHGVISEIFANYGEEYFRDLESRTVEEVCALSNVLIATGGGCLLREENVKRFKRSGKIVYLRTELETLIKRVSGNSDRPLLQGDTRARLTKLYGERSHIYANAADIIIDTDSLTPEEIANKITELIK